MALKKFSIKNFYSNGDGYTLINFFGKEIKTKMLYFPIKSAYYKILRFFKIKPKFTVYKKYISLGNDCMPRAFFAEWGIKP